MSIKIWNLKNLKKYYHCWQQNKTLLLCEDVIITTKFVLVIMSRKSFPKSTINSSKAIDWLLKPNLDKCICTCVSLISQFLMWNKFFFFFFTVYMYHNNNNLYISTFFVNSLNHTSLFQTYCIYLSIFTDEILLLRQ